MSGLLSPAFGIVVIVIALLSGSLAVIREIQMMYAPAKATDKKVFWGFVRVAFVIAAVLLWWDEHSKVQDLLRISASGPRAYVESTELGVIAPSYHIGGKWALANTCKNSSSVVAEDATCIRWIGFVKTAPNGGSPFVLSDEQERAYQDFERGIGPYRADPRKSFGPGHEEFQTVESAVTIDEKLDGEFRGEKKTIIFIAEYDWTDGGGPHTNEVCQWLQLPSSTFSKAGTIAAGVPITWHICFPHNGLLKTGNRRK
jgi:hypothetical protein